MFHKILTIQVKPTSLLLSNLIFFSIKDEISPNLSPQRRFPDSPAIDLNSEDGGELLNSESIKRSPNFSDSPQPKSKFLMKGTKTPSKPNSKTPSPNKKLPQNSDKNVDMKRLIKEMGKRTTPTSTPTKQLSKNTSPAKKDVSRKNTNQSKEQQPNQNNIPNVEFEKAFKAYIADYSDQMEKVVNNKVSYALNFEWKRSAYRIQRMFFDFFVQKSRLFHNSLIQKMQDHLISYVEETELAHISAKMTGLTQEFDALWNFEEIRQSLGLEEMTALSFIANPNEVDSLILEDLEKDPHKGIFNITNVVDNNVMVYLKEEIQTNINKTFISLNTTIQKDLAKSEALTLNLLKKSVQHIYTDLGKNLHNIIPNKEIHEELERINNQKSSPSEKKGILRNPMGQKDFIENSQNNEVVSEIAAHKLDEFKKNRKDFRENYPHQDIVDQSSEIVYQFEEFPNKEENPEVTSAQNKSAFARNEISTDDMLKNFDMERISDHLNEKRKETLKNDFKIKFQAESEASNNNNTHPHYDETPTDNKKNDERKIVSNESRENITLNKRISQMSGVSQDSVETLMKPRLTQYQLDQDAGSNAISKRVSSSSGAVETTVPQNQIENEVNLVDDQIDECTEKDSIRQTADCTVNFEDNNKEIKQMSKTIDERDSDHHHQEVLNHSGEIDEEQIRQFLEQNPEEEHIKSGSILAQSPSSKQENSKNAHEENPLKRTHSREDNPLKRSHLPGAIEESTPRSQTQSESQAEENSLKRSHLSGAVQENTPRQSENQAEENPLKRSSSSENKQSNVRNSHEENPLQTKVHNEKVFAAQNQDQDQQEGIQSISELNCGGDQKHKKLLTINSYESDEEENKKGEHIDHLNTPNFSNSAQAQAQKKSNSVSSFQTLHGRTAASRSKSGFIVGSLTDADADVDKISAINSREHSPERPFGKSGTDFFDRSEHDMSISSTEVSLIVFFKYFL